MMCAERKMVQETGSEPNEEELARELDIDPNAVQEMRKAAERTTSFEAPVGSEKDVKLGDLIVDSGSPDLAEMVSGIIAKESPGRVLKAMNERERKVIELRFGLKGGHPRTLDDVGSCFNVSRECSARSKLRPSDTSRRSRRSRPCVSLPKGLEGVRCAEIDSVSTDTYLVRQITHE